MSPLGGSVVSATGPTERRLNVADVLRDLTDSFLAHNPDRLAPHVRSTLRRLRCCRTSVLGGHLYRCGACQSELPLYNSCGDRHCPRCRGARRGQWVEHTERLLHPAVTYFQVVFTLPEQLSSLLLGNRAVGYALLFRAAWEALREAIEEECGYQPAATFVLHTWNQRLEHHPHVHALVTGNGPSRDGQRWVACRQTRGKRRRASRPFLVDNRRLSRRFRDRFLAGLKRLARRGDLSYDTAALQAMIESLQDRDWVVFVQPPPSGEADPAQVLKYLARYMTGGPISDRRIVELNATQVTILARDKNKSGRQVPVRLARHEFIRRWCLHILPKGFTKARSFGGWSSQRREAYLRQVHDLASATGAVKSPANEPQPEAMGEAPLLPIAPPSCRACQATMTLAWSAPRPSWRDIFYSASCPAPSLSSPWIPGGPMR